MYLGLIAWLFGLGELQVLCHCILLTLRALDWGICVCVTHLIKRMHTHICTLSLGARGNPTPNKAAFLQHYTWGFSREVRQCEVQVPAPDSAASSPSAPSTIPLSHLLHTSPPSAGDVAVALLAEQGLP